jgi:hypothetical protein
MDATFEQLWPSNATLDHPDDPGAMNLEFIVAVSSSPPSSYIETSAKKVDVRAWYPIYRP